MRSNSPAAVAFRTAAVARNRRSPAIETLEARQLMSAAISGNVFNDSNASGVFKSGDAEMKSVRIYVDLGNTGSIAGADPTTLTDSNGNYTISGLTPGMKTVREVVPPAFSQTLPANNAAANVMLASNTSHAQNVNFGNTQKVRISGFVFNDLNKDGNRQGTEADLGNVTVFLDTNGNRALDPGEAIAVTNSSGKYTFNDLPAGKQYDLGVDLAGSKAGPYTGWVQTSPGGGEDVLVTAAPGLNYDFIGFGIHAPAKITFNSENRTVLAIADGKDQTFTSTLTGQFAKLATIVGSSPSHVASSSMNSQVYAGGIFAGGNLSATGFTNADSAFSDVDVTFTLATATTFQLAYNITGNGFYFALKDLTTGVNVIAPTQANASNPHFSYSLLTGGTLAAGKYQLLFNNNNAAGQSLQTLGYSMNLSL